MKEGLLKNSLFDIAITSATTKEVLEYVVGKIENTQEKFYIVTPNPEMVVYANKVKHFRTILNQAQISLCDGIGLFMASKLLGKPLKERITGVRMVEEFCKNITRKPITVGFLGGRGGVAGLAAECLKAKYPGLKVAFVGEEMEGISNSRPTASDKRPKSIDILFVAFGFPKQEQWMLDHINKVPVRVMMGVGGAFDELSGRIPRCPEWIDRIGSKWLWRLAIQPWRWKRQLALMEFIWMVIKERLSGNNI